MKILSDTYWQNLLSLSSLIMTIAQSLERASENSEKMKQGSAATPGNAATPSETPFQDTGEVHNVRGSCFLQPDKNKQTKKKRNNLPIHVSAEMPQPLSGLTKTK